MAESRRALYCVRQVWLDQQVTAALPPTDGVATDVGASTGTPEPARGRVGTVRAVGAIALAAGVLSIGFWICTWQIFVALFTGVGPLVVVAVTGAAALLVILVELRAVTGRWRIGAALVAVLSALAVLVAGALRTGGWGVLFALQNGLVFLLFGVVCALTVGLFIGPRWMRIVGAVALVVVVAFAAAPWSFTQADAEPDPSVALDAHFDEIIATSQAPVVPDHPDDVVEALEPAPWNTVAWVRAYDGAALTIEASGGNTASEDPGLPCGSMLKPTEGFEPPITIEDFGGACARDGSQWVTADGTARAMWLGDVLVVLRAADPAAFAEPQAARAATADDLAVAATRLRTLDETEFRELYRPQWDAAHGY